MDQLSFYSLFEANKNGLKEKLTGLTIPNDSAKIQKIVGQSLETIFDEKSEMRQSLTQSEDYILQAAMTLLTAQQKIAIEATNFEIRNEEQATRPQAAGPEPIKASNPIQDKEEFLTKENVKIVAGAAIGGIAGKLVVDIFTPKAVSAVAATGAWGAVFGAIAGTALILYYSASKGKNGNSQTSAPAIEAPRKTDISNKGAEINTENYLSIVGEICKSIDSLIDTYRSQIKRVVNHYENQEKPSLEKEYRILLEEIQSLLGYERSHSQEEEKFYLKLKERIDDLSESLENYNINVVDYDGNNKAYFNMVPSANATEPRMVLPAFIKDNIVILPGKVFIKE